MRVLVLCGALTPRALGPLSTRLAPPPEEMARVASPFTVFGGGSQNYHGILIRNPEILIFLVWGTGWTIVFFFFF